MSRAAAQRWLGSLPSRATVRVTDDLTTVDALLPAYPLVPGELQFSISGQEPRTIIRLGLPTDDFGDVRKVRRLSILAASVREALRAELREALGKLIRLMRCIAPAIATMAKASFWCRHRSSQVSRADASCHRRHYQAHWQRRHYRRCL